VCGARLRASYFRVGGLAMDLPDGFLDRCQKFVDEMPAHVDEYEALLSKNPIWLARLKGVALLSKQDAIALGATGPVLRGSGVAWDLRKAQPYCDYDDYDFEIPVGSAGDAYDRYQVRVQGMRRPTRIERRGTRKTGAPGEQGDCRLRDYRYGLPPKGDGKPAMGALTPHSKVGPPGFFPPVGEAYHAIEAPKGELGFYFVS